jgi:hypothetical protein
MLWRNVTCPVCGVRYRDFRAEGQPTFADASATMIEQAKRFAAGGDYSKPARRSSILGHMHGWKKAWWELHLEECRHYQDQADRESLAE